MLQPLRHLKTHGNAVGFLFYILLGFECFNDKYPKCPIIFPLPRSRVKGTRSQIGKNAFTPLDDSYLSDDNNSALRNPRVIGITDGSKARAYSIPKLRHHEIANTRIGAKPVAAGY
ncbi:MAG: hypothetical protein BBJ57_10205 [Desulfobacterales bacterium PC51MH44]|nr:MAG: hypothetical protein BBJ57_10205 [Desulfobacterales bacterium PC51MH44]